MENNSSKNNQEKQFLCLDERQTTWCICLNIVLLCIIMLTSYIAGYRSAVRTIVDAAKKDSFADQVYTSVSSTTLAHQDEYYVQCKVPDTNEIQNSIELALKEGIALSLLVNPELEENCHYLVTAMMQTYDEATAIATVLKNKINIDQYTILTAQKTQKLKGYVL